MLRDSGEDEVGLGLDELSEFWNEIGLATESMKSSIHLEVETSGTVLLCSRCLVVVYCFR